MKENCRCFFFLLFLFFSFTNLKPYNPIEPHPKLNQQIVFSPPSPMSPPQIVIVLKELYNKKKKKKKTIEEKKIFLIVRKEAPGHP